MKAENEIRKRNNSRYLDAMRHFFVCIVLTLSCKNPVREPSDQLEKKSVVSPLDVKINGSLHAVKCPGVTAVFAGKVEEVPSSSPKSYATTGLSFRFDDGKELLFKPNSELNFSDWSFDVFSTDCSMVSILTDHYGPYLLMPIGQLRAYLEGRAIPIVVQAKSSAQNAMVHSQGIFTSTNVFEFVASCCGGAQAYSADTSGKLTLLLDANKAEHGLLKTKSGWDIIK
jgi:hypothetical protein